MAKRAAHVRRPGRVAGSARPRRRDPRPQRSRGCRSSSSSSRRAAAANGIRVHWAETTDEANAIVLELLKAARRHARGEGEVDGLRGDAPERLPRGSAASSRSSRTWASTSSSSTARRPRTSSCRRSTRTEQQIARLFGRKIRDAKYTEDVDELTAIARRVLRRKFFEADAGISGRQLRRGGDGDARAWSRTRATGGCPPTCRRSTSRSWGSRRSSRGSRTCPPPLRPADPLGHGPDRSRRTST